MIVDGVRLEQSAYLHIALSEQSGYRYVYHIAIPEDRELTLKWSFQGIESGIQFFTIPKPNFFLEGKEYRIFNKIAAMEYAPCDEGIFVDSDTFFHKQPSADFFIRDVPCASPEHNLPVVFDDQSLWEEIYQKFDLHFPPFKVLTGSGRYALPWFNAGLISTSNLPKLGEVWRETCEQIAEIKSVPKKFPYLDQIALPVAFARSMNSKQLSHDNILPRRCNLNLFFFQAIHEIDRNAILYHHHDRVSIVRALFPQKLVNAARRWPIVAHILPELAKREMAAFLRTA